MVKFCKENFKYNKRLSSAEQFSYIFSVHGESANYFINKYELEFQNVFVNCDLDKKYIYICWK